MEQNVKPWIKDAYSLYELLYNLKGELDSVTVGFVDSYDLKDIVKGVDPDFSFGFPGLDEIVINMQSPGFPDYLKNMNAKTAVLDYDGNFISEGHLNKISVSDEEIKQCNGICEADAIGASKYSHGVWFAVDNGDVAMARNGKIIARGKLDRDEFYKLIEENKDQDIPEIQKLADRDYNGVASDVYDMVNKAILDSKKSMVVVFGNDNLFEEATLVEGEKGYNAGTPEFEDFLKNYQGKYPIGVRSDGRLVGPMYLNWLIKQSERPGLEGLAQDISATYQVPTTYSNGKMGGFNQGNHVFDYNPHNILHRVSGPPIVGENYHADTLRQFMAGLY